MALEEEVAAAHEAEVVDLRSEYEQRIRDLQAEVLDGTRKEMRDRLLALAGYTGAAAGQQREAR